MVHLLILFILIMNKKNQKLLSPWFGLKVDVVIEIEDNNVTSYLFRMVHFLILFIYLSIYLFIFNLINLFILLLLLLLLLFMNK
jgi:hypothetical protein